MDMGELLTLVEDKPSYSSAPKIPEPGSRPDQANGLGLGWTQGRGIGGGQIQNQAKHRHHRDNEKIQGAHGHWSKQQQMHSSMFSRFENTP
jgi:hypothetical protein